MYAAHCVDGAVAVRDRGSTLLEALVQLQHVAGLHRCRVLGGAYARGGAERSGALRGDARVGLEAEHRMDGSLHASALSRVESGGEAGGERAHGHGEREELHGGLSAAAMRCCRRPLPAGDRPSPSLASDGSERAPALRRIHERHLPGICGKCRALPATGICSLPRRSPVAR